MAEYLNSPNASGAMNGSDSVCEHCHEPFVPYSRARRRQRFCSKECRKAHQQSREGHGMRGVVSSVRLLKRGGVSVTLRFALDERDRAVRLEPGRIVEILES